MREDRERSAVGRTAGVAHRTVFHLPFHGRSDVIPVDSDAAGGCIGGKHLTRSDAGGDIVERQVVDVSIPRAGGAVGLNGYVMAIAGIAGQGDFDQRPRRAAVDRHRVDTHKRVDVVGVGHHANLERRRVSGRRGSGPEAELQAVDADGSVKLRQHNALVVAVCGRSGGIVVPVETFAAAGGVVVRTAANVWVSTVGGAVVEMVVADNEVGGRRAGAGGVDVQIVGPRHHGNRAAFGAEGL